MDGVISIPQGIGYGVFTLDFTPFAGKLYIFSVDEATGDLTFRSSYNVTNSWSGHFTNTMGLRLWVLTADTALTGETFKVSLTCTASDLEGIFTDILEGIGGVDDITNAENWDDGNSLTWYHIVGIVLMVLMMNGVFCIWCYLKKKGGSGGGGVFQQRAYDQHGGGQRLQML